MYQLPVSEESFDLIVLHMVLHFSDRPAEVIAEAARALASGGHFLIVDFAPHSMEELRDEHAHRRLGFARDEVESWCRDNDLDVTEVRDLEGDPLTVSIWKSRRPAAVVRSRQPSAAQDAAQGTERTMAHPSQHISDNISVSFEFFPPKTAEAESALWDTVCRLAPLQPAFVSVTYGAGGTTREHTHATVTRIARETALTPAAHLTCVDATRGEVDDIARQYWDTGIRHLVALRGDPPDGAGSYSPATGGYAYASDLVAGLCKVADFEISVAAYPEVHPDAPSPTFDFDNLKRKIDAGASRAITQFFFDNSAYLRFRDAVAAAGIDAPLVPGIMPVTNFSGILRFAERCGASIPARLADAFAGLDDDADGRRRIAEEIACDQCLDLAEHGVCEFHFYTLNRAELTAAICQRLGVVTTEAPLSKKLEAAR
jgi:methylenetetrahydrofolate reductase (NADPH)